MAVPPRAMPERKQEVEDDDDDFTFPTPPPQTPLPDRDRHRVFHRLPCSSSASSSPPVWLMLSSSASSPIRRSFSAADCAASPWRARPRGSLSPALSDYGVGGFCDGEDDEEEEERMDCLWEDLNNDDDAAAGDAMFLGSLDVARRRSVGWGAGTAERARKAAKEREAGVLGASRSSRRRPPGLVGMMRALRRMFVAHKSKSKVHRDEQSTASASAFASSPSPFSRSNNLPKKR